ncbi:Protein CBG26564 [Caenorhabditis briggsae]|uniref:Protein CBG26564 n=1 Tax=Caenorhabditis briggsae TaxID=6238 RepID=B6IGZ8_CAEBR|nr:Protein CBG26564 [Caenorhabditis briggsae]CAR99178.1 Protein CBG26564 [Caenorhabditis briggsae]
MSRLRHNPYPHGLSYNPYAGSRIPASLPSSSGDESSSGDDEDLEDQDVALDVDLFGYDDATDYMDEMLFTAIFERLRRRHRRERAMDPPMAVPWHVPTQRTTRTTQRTTGTATANGRVDNDDDDPVFGIQAIRDMIQVSEPEDDGEPVPSADNVARWLGSHLDQEMGEMEIEEGQPPVVPEPAEGTPAEPAPGGAPEDDDDMPFEDYYPPVNFSATFYLFVLLLFIFPVYQIVQHPKEPPVYHRKLYIFPQGHRPWTMPQLIAFNINIVFFFIFLPETLIAHMILQW